MTNKKSTKRSLLFSALSLFLCIGMLAGTTFAWFTDSVSSKNNVIMSGNLDVELYWSIDGEQWDKVDEQDEIFKDETLWEPGHTEVVYLKVVNEGSLALKYQLGVNIVDEKTGTNMAGDSFKLSDYIEFGVKETAEAISFEKREDALTAIEEYQIISAGYTNSSKLGAKNNAQNLASEEYATLVVTMPETVGNVANHNGKDIPFIQLGITLFATQQAAEEDSFDANYDKDAWHPEMKVYSAEDLQAAINNGETNIVLMDDITLTESIVVPAPAATTYSLRTAATVIDLNGNEITSNLTSGRAILVQGAAEIKNGTITTTNGVTGLRATGKSASLTLTDMTVSVTGTGSNAEWNHTAIGAANGATVVINNGTYSAEVGYGLVTMTSGADITINDGTFTTKGTTNSAAVRFDSGWDNSKVYTKAVINGGVFNAPEGGFAFTANNAYGKDITINGGTFNGELDSSYQDNGVVINGGTFNKPILQRGGHQDRYLINGGTFVENVSAKVANGFKAVESNGKFVVVSDTIADENVVGTPAELESALSGAADAGSGDNTIYLTGDIDMSATAWTPIKVDGYNGAGIVTIEGNYATIKGLTAPLFAGGFAGKSGIVIKNLTIADSNIVGGTLGGGAFVDTADSMQVVTLENCHLVKSTVSGERVGGLIGWVSGYSNQNDGPVKTYVTVSNCSVVDSTVIGNGSAGAIAGHPGASDYTYTTIENCLVKNVDVISYEPVSSWRTGAIVGTANNGHVVINNVTVEDVTLTQDGVTAEETKLYGRFVPGTTGTLVIDGKTVTSNAADVVNGGNFLLTGDIQNNSAIKNDTSIDLGGNTFEATGTVNLTGNADLTMTNGDYVVNGTFGHIDVRPDSAEGSTLLFENVDFSYNKLEKTYGPSTNRLGTVVEICAAAADAKSVVVFRNCTFNNAQVLIEGLSGKIGIVDVTFENCTFNALTSSAPIKVDNYVNGKVTVTGCTFNLECTSSVASAISVNPSSSTVIELIASNNTINATAATASGENGTVEQVKVNGTPANIKFISAYDNATVTETNTVKSGIAKQ